MARQRRDAVRDEGHPGTIGCGIAGIGGLRGTRVGEDVRVAASRTDPTIERDPARLQPLGQRRQMADADGHAGEGTENAHQQCGRALIGEDGVVAPGQDRSGRREAGANDLHERCAGRDEDTVVALDLVCGEAVLDHLRDHLHAALKACREVEDADGTAGAGRTAPEPCRNGHRAGAPREAARESTAGLDRVAHSQWRRHIMTRIPMNQTDWPRLKSTDSSAETRSVKIQTCVA